MIKNDLRDVLAMEGYEHAGIFNCPSYDNSIVGCTESGAIVYDFELMIDEFMSENPECTKEEAAEFINYNTIRTIPYMTDHMIPPVILYPIQKIIQSKIDILGVNNEH